MRDDGASAFDLLTDVDRVRAAVHVGTVDEIAIVDDRTDLAFSIVAELFAMGRPEVVVRPASAV